MSRKPKIIPPINGSFNDILASIAMGRGTGKRAAVKLARKKRSKPNNTAIPPNQ
jgi:hypothetical protein